MKCFLLIFLLAGIASCGKKTQIKVTAKNAATGEGYAGLGFQLIEIKPYTSSTGEIQNLVYEGTLNQQGEAVFEYRLKNRSYLITTLVPEEELCYINNTKYSLHRDDDDLTFDFRFAECAYLKLEIENVNCQGTNDTIIINQQNQVGSFIDKDWILTGCNGYTTAWTDVPVGYFYIDWTVIRGGLSESFSDTLFLDEGEELSYEINY